MFRSKFSRLLLAAGLTLASSAAFAETVTIRYSNWLPPKFFLWENALFPWIQEVEKVTEGRVKVEVLPKVVGTAASQFDVIRDGLADMAWITAPYTPGRFPSSEFGELPLLESEAKIVAPIYDRLYRKHIEKQGEFKGVEVMGIFTISPSQIFTNKPINSIADMAGKKLRSPTNTITEELTLMSAVPVHKSSTEANELLSTGQIDGQVTQANTVVGFNQIDLTKFGYVLPGGMSNAVNLVGMNPAKWAEISEADQKAIIAISHDKLATRVGDAYSAAETAAFETMKKAGYTLVEPDAIELAKITELLKPIEQKWIEKAKAAGLTNAEEVLAEYRAEIKAARGSN